MVLVATNAQISCCPDRNIPFSTTDIDESIDDFSVAATLKQSNVTINCKVRL